MSRRPVVLFTRGAPGSGKSTWAKGVADGLPAGRVKLVSLDDLRSMVDRGRAFVDGMGKVDETLVKRVHDQVVYEAVARGRDVIVHNTHANPSTPARISRMIAVEADVAIVDFTDVPLQDCLHRDKVRPKNVGPDVVGRIYQEAAENRGRFRRWQILSPREACELLLSDAPAKPKLQVWQDETLPETCLVDLDGTLAIHQGRNPYDAANCHTDKFNVQVARAAAGQPHVILCSGRSDKHESQTVDWFVKSTTKAREDGLLTRDQEERLLGAKLMMRAGDDQRPDSVVKLEIYTERIRPHFHVTAVFDDRNSVVRMWRLLGLPCWQVAEGDF